MLQELSDKRLLLLEDNLEFVDNAVALFKLFVAHVIVAHTIKEALHVLQTERIHIIISDIHLKNENGLDFIRDVRQSDTHTPIVVLSGDKDEELLFRAMTLGLSGYLVKPINFKRLSETLEICLHRLKNHAQTLVPLKDGYAYDRGLKVVVKDGVESTLNKKEILFFEMLCDNKNQLLTRDMFLAFVYEYEPMSDSALNNFIMRLRRRFGKHFLHTIPDVGYKLIV